MGDNLEEMLNITIKRLDVIMEDTKLALTNKAENLIKSAISILKEHGFADEIDTSPYWEKLYGYARELYIETIRHMPETNEKDQYSQAHKIMNIILVCKKNLMLP